MGSISGELVLVTLVYLPWFSIEKRKQHRYFKQKDGYKTDGKANRIEFGSLHYLYLIDR